MELLAERRQKMLVSTMISVIMALVVFLLVMAISNDSQKSWDLTVDQRYSFSPQTEQVVSGLTQNVKLYAFVDPAGSSQVIEELLDRYRKLSPHFEYEVVDLQKDPSLAERMKVRNYGVGVLEKVEKDLPEGELPRRERILRFDEATITNGLTKLLRSEEKVVYFVAGHGERRPDRKETREMTQLSASLRTEGYTSKVLSLADVEKVPEDATLLIAAGPTGELLDKEQAVLDAYLRSSGKLFFMADIQTPEYYVEWLKPYGFTIEDSVLVDETSAKVGAEPVTPIGAEFSPDHPITKGFANFTAFTLARPIDLGEISAEGLAGNTTSLVQTQETAFRIPLKDILDGQTVTFSAEGKTPGRYTLAAAGRYSAEGATPEPTPSPGEEQKTPPQTRVVVSSSADTFSNSFLGQAGNRDFCLNAINWLAESENQITVRAKDPRVQPISLSKQTQNWLYFLFCLLIPFLSAFTGILITYYRRKGEKL